MSASTALDPDYDTLLGYRVENARRTLGLSQEQLAERLLVHRQTVQKIEVGKRSVKASEIEPLASALQVPISWLVTGETAQEAQAEARLRTAMNYAILTLREAQS